MNDWKPRMDQAVRHLAEQVAAIRGGTIDAGLVASVRVAIDGRSSTLGHLSAVANSPGRLVVRPYEASHVPAIVKALTAAQMGAFALDPRTVAVPIPPISGEQREAIARHVKRLAEDAKIAVRRVRQDARKAIAASGRGSERRVQDATDAAIAAIDTLTTAKLKEIGA